MENCNSVNECIKEPTITEEEATQPSTTVDNSCGGSGETGGSVNPGVTGGCPEDDPEDCTGGTTSGNGSGTTTTPGTDCGDTEHPDTDDDCEFVCVSSVRVSNTSITIQNGACYQLTATVLPTNATNKTVTWYSNNTSIARVSSSGIVYGVSPGQTLITVVANDGSGERDFAVVQVTNDTLLVESVDLDRNVLNMNKGDSYTLTATVCPDNATNTSVTWKSTNSKVATVNSNGKVTAVSGGDAYITAAANDCSGKSASCRVKVTGEVLATDVTIMSPPSTMKIGQTADLSAQVCPNNVNMPCVTWSSSDSNIASVISSSGMVRAKAPGTVTITATTVDGTNISDCCDITVEPIYVEEITLSSTTMSMHPGDTATLTATVCPENATDNNIIWYVSDSNVATVDSCGSVRAKNVGTALITASAKDGSGIKAQCGIYVSGITECSSKESDIKSDNSLPTTVSDPIDVLTGAQVIDNNIMSLFSGQKLSLKASYNSTKLASGDMGRGWYHNYEKRVEFFERSARVYNSPSEYSLYEADSTGSAYTCTTASKGNYTLTRTLSSEYPYMLNCGFDSTEYYNADGYIGKIVDKQGFETHVEYSNNVIRINDAVSGKSLYLEKDANSRIVKVYDDNGRATNLTYSGDLLTRITDPCDNILSYTYNEDGQILTGTDSKGTRYFENTYDCYGRIVDQKDGITGSALSHIDYCSDGTRTLTDRNGNVSYKKFDVETGALVSSTDANGNTTTYEYDLRYNVIRETDANGNYISKGYNTNNKPTYIRDKNGNSTNIDYDGYGNVKKIRYPKVGDVTPEESFIYNDRNQLISYTDVRGTVTLYTYDDFGMPLTKKVGSKNAVQYSYQNGLLLSETDAMGKTLTYTYNALGQLASVTDSENHVTSYEYNACGDLTKTTDANGKTTTATYDGNHQRISFTDANGNKTEYTYNGNMKNTSVRYADGGTVSYKYDGEDRPTEVTDQAGKITTTTYDKGGRAVSVKYADGAIVKYEYDKVGNIVKEINPKGAVTEKTYDALGNVLSVKDSDGNLTRYQYDSRGNVIRAVNAMSGTTLYEYSVSGELLSETDALGNKRSYTYDLYGNRLTATDARGNTTFYTYDANNRLLTVTDPLNNTTINTYNALGQLASVTDARGNTVSYTYDALGRRTEIRDAKGNVYTTVYDANGNIIKTLDAKGNTVSEAVYNSLNLPSSVKDSAGKTTTYTYNKLGKVESVTDAFSYRTEYTYDSRGRNIRVLDANNCKSEAKYDVMGNMTRLEGPLGGATNYTYDAKGRLISQSTTSGGSITYTYNELNIKEKLTNARGQVRKYFHDAKGRIIGYVGAEDSVSYTYDANGNVLTVTDANGCIAREYDELNRVKKYTDTYGNTIKYEYDEVGNLSRLIYPDNTVVSYTYDANNNMTGVTDWANRVTSYTYDVNNRVVGISNPDGSTVTTVYDNAGRVISSIDRMANGTVISGYEYTYDNLSRITTEKDLAKNNQLCYTYDKLSRVISKTVTNECGNIVSSEAFNYDAAGNITNAPDSCFVYDTNNRLTTFDGHTVKYDADGNMLSNGTLTCAYDSANRLLKAGSCTYTYNAEDVRIRNLRNGVDNTYVYNTNCKLSQLLLKTTDGIKTKYVYGLGLIGEERNGYIQVYHYDYRGSTVAVTNECGEITDTFEYDTYGKLLTEYDYSDAIFLYNGRDGVITDKNGLVYMRARYYSPEMRRFINADIIPGEISNAITLNRYAYANGNPVSNVDPFGLSAERGIGFEWDVGTTDIIRWGKDAISIIQRAYYRWKYGFSVYKKGAYAIVKGVRSFATTNQGIQGTRYAFANASKYGNVFKYVSPKVAVKDALTGKGSIFGYTMVAVDTGLGIYENIQNGTRPQKTVSDAVVDAGLGIGSMALSAAAGAKIGALAGSVFPGLGNVIGAAGGALVGFGAYMLTDVVTINGKTGSEWIKEGAAVVADGLVDAGQWVADTAVDVWNEATEIVEDAGEWIADTASDVWDATTDFVEDAGNAVGDFFSGLFSW